MRLSADHIEQLKRLALEEAGEGARLRLFGSRLDDAAVGMLVTAADNMLAELARRGWITQKHSAGSLPQ